MVLTAVLACPALCYGGLACDHDAHSEPCQDAGHLPYSCLCKGATIPLGNAGDFARIVLNQCTPPVAMVLPLGEHSGICFTPIASELLCNPLAFLTVGPLLI